MVPAQSSFEAVGFTIENLENDGRPWHKLRRDDMVISCWPRRDGGATWMAFGRTFRVDADQLLSAIESGRIAMPADADEAKCRYCDARIWWSTTSKGKNVPLDANGEMHFSGCGGR